VLQHMDCACAKWLALVFFFNLAVVGAKFCSFGHFQFQCFKLL
jgi:hypothetical protein